MLDLSLDIIAGKSNFVKRKTENIFPVSLQNRALAVVFFYRL
jgi:hypothetical protein